MAADKASAREDAKIALAVLATAQGAETEQQAKAILKKSLAALEK